MRTQRSGAPHQIWFPIRSLTLQLQVKMQSNAFPGRFANLNGLCQLNAHIYKQVRHMRNDWCRWAIKHEPFPNFSVDMRYLWWQWRMIMRKVVEGNYRVNENRRQQQRKGNINKNEHEKKISALTYLGLVPFQNTLCLSAVETHAHKLIPTHRSQSKSILRDPSELKQKKIKIKT